MKTHFNLTEYSDLAIYIESNHRVTKAAVKGSCCWKLFKGDKFRSKSAKLRIGSYKYLAFSPRSMRTHSC